MNVSAISSAVAADNSTDPATESAFGDAFIGKDGFLKLLITQLQNQDPLEPMSNEDFAAQLAQFSSLEQMQNLNESFGKLTDLTKLGSSASLIGKDVTYQDQSTGQNISGVVDKVLIKSDGLYFSINGKQVSAGLVDEIAQAVPAPVN
jgi:flagellar basal-body rod modification protein FlgD